MIRKMTLCNYQLLLISMFLLISCGGPGRIVIPDPDYDPDVRIVGSSDCISCGNRLVRECRTNEALPTWVGFNTDGQTCSMGCDNSTVFTIEIPGDPSSVCEIELNLKPHRLSQLCPLDHYRGDAEYAGHGPTVTINIRLFAVGADLNVDVDYDAQETGFPAETAVRGSWTKNVASLNSTRPIRIAGILSEDTYSIGPRNLSGHGPHLLERRGFLLVNSIAVVGDTGGTDIPNSTNCNDETHIQEIVFNPIRVRLEQIP